MRQEHGEGGNGKACLPHATLSPLLRMFLCFLLHSDGHRWELQCFFNFSVGGKSQITDNVLKLQPFEEKGEPKVNRLFGPFSIAPCRYATPVNGVHKINGKSV